MEVVLGTNYSVWEPIQVAKPDFPPVCSGKDLYRFLSVSAFRKGTRNNPMALVHDDFEDQAIAKHGSKLHEVNLFYGVFEYARPNYGLLLHILTAGQGLITLSPILPGRLSFS